MSHQAAHPKAQPHKATHARTAQPHTAAHVPAAQPLFNVAVPTSFRIEAVDAKAEQTAGHATRAALRKARGLPDNVSLLHPDKPKFPSEFVAQPVPQPGPQQPLQPTPTTNETSTGVEPGSLGIALSKFVGEFQGNGFNSILRPQNGPNGQGTSDNLLELNFTHETLTFLAEDVLGDIPNRGSQLQPDINLRGIPYTQRIKDLANGETGKGDLPIDTAPAIHFEQGLFVRTPALIPWKDNTFTAKVDTPILPATVSRMASIPHGTTINAQALDPTTVTPGAPVFQNLDVQNTFPFSLDKTPADAADPSFFPQLQFKTDVTKDRIPLDLRKFDTAGTINEAQFKNPENYLKDNNDKKTIKEHITFTVDTQPQIALWGGGTDNVAHLAEHEVTDPTTGEVETNDASKPLADGTVLSTANANAIHVACKYWISSVEETITIPVFDKATLPRINQDPAKKDDFANIVWPVVSPTKIDGVGQPDFQITLDKNDTEFQAKVLYTQIQYAQTVMLDFNTLRWPHVSVNSLVPSTPVIIATEADFTRV
ncbi:uncharacterized protein AB675_7297 [Cyphellophora attinorum]|uniref:Uncharacterized protein n=1 Tax=Cyphellophora attinorum TaxID=1664694 RepID=A0A0N0NJ00_9EURO|nr:uncharacterized protein AB675_7297 [Phialophora attinorum]KPI36338.1 hypothetical protein AB675_7297 [Phialophora attinorum]